MSELTEPIIDEIWRNAKITDITTFAISSIIAIVLYLFNFDFWWFPPIIIMFKTLIYFERRVHQSLILIERQLDDIYEKDK
jgi:hypothetical protein